VTTLNSTISTVKDRLVVLLLQRSGLTGVQVTRGHPGNALEKEALIIGIAKGRHAPAAITSGRMPREETYSLDIIASVMVPAGTIADAEDRCHELIAEVEEQVASDPTLGLVLGSSGVQSFSATPGDLEERGSGYIADPPGTIAEVVLRVDIKARLS